MKRFPYFPLYPSDFASDGRVESMTTEEVGAYWLLLMKAWGENPVGTVPDDDRVLARWARLPPSRWKKAKSAVMGPWLLHSDGRWHQKRMEKEHVKLVEGSERQKKRAMGRWGLTDAAARPRQGHGNADGAIPEACPSESESESSPSLVPPEGDGEKEMAEPSPEARPDMWRNIRDRLQGKIDPKEFRTWFTPTRQLEFDPNTNGGVLSVSVPSKTFADWIGRRHGELLAQEAAAVGFPRLEFRFTPAA